MRKNIWTEAPSWYLWGNGRHTAQVWKVNRSWLQYEQGQRYHIVAIVKDGSVTIVRPYELPTMTIKEMTKEFRYIPGLQPLSLKRTKQRKGLMINVK